MPFCQQLWGCNVHPHRPTLLPHLPHQLHEGCRARSLRHPQQPGGMHLHHCVCHTTLQFNNDKPEEHTNYAWSHLILPCRDQYSDQLLPAILKPWNHQGLLIDSVMKEPYPMELVGDFQAADPIFKGCYGDSLLYSDADLHWLRWWGIHLPTFQGEILMPPAPLHQQARGLR